MSFIRSAISARCVEVYIRGFTFGFLPSRYGKSGHDSSSQFFISAMELLQHSLHLSFIAFKGVVNVLIR
jgi:hypothetical protein